jgi:FkbM family methyltransferase
MKSLTSRDFGNAANDELIASLKQASSRSQMGRWARLARQPVGAVLPPLLRKLGITRRTAARTFFGETFNLVLPEPVSVSIWRDGVFEPDVAFYLLSMLRPGDCFIDVGGHFGFFSSLGRKVVGDCGQVITFEPMPKTREILQANLGNESQWMLVPAAAGEAPGKLYFRDFGLTGSAFNTATDVRSNAFNELERVEVTVETLDAVASRAALTSCRLVKIDAENAELSVLKGAQSLIEKFRPAFIVETGDMGDGGQTREVADFLLVRGYKAFEFQDWKILPHEIRKDYGYQNLLFIHQRELREQSAPPKAQGVQR